MLGSRFFQNLFDKYRIKGVITLILVISYLIYDTLSFFLPQRNIEVVIDHFYFNIGLFLNLYQILNILLIKESDINSFFSSSSSSSRPVNIRFRVLRWRKLDDKLNVRNIDTSRSNISGYQYFLFSLSKLSHIRLSNILTDISMKNDYFIAIEVFNKLISFDFSLSKDNCSILRIVFLDKSQNYFMSFVLFNV